MQATWSGSEYFVVRDFPAGHGREAGGSGIGEGAEEIVSVWSSSRPLFMMDTTLPYSGEPVLLGAFVKDELY
jgi:hypothetical protein